MLNRLLMDLWQRISDLKEKKKRDQPPTIDNNINFGDYFGISDLEKFHPVYQR